MKAKKVILIILAIIFSALFCLSGFMVVRGLLGYKKASQFYDDLQNRFVNVDTDEALDTSSDAEDHTDTAFPDKTDPDEDKSESSTPSKKPSSSKNKSRAPIKVDFDSLLDCNGDIAGWLYCKGTPMNYPVVQTTDNSYYLRRDLNGNYLVTGTIFADCRCEAPTVDKNYVIFGHNMDDGTIFGMLKNYSKADYLKSHPVLYYLTPEADYKIEVYTGVTVNKSDRIYRVYDEEGVIDYVRSLAAYSEVEPPFELSEDDHLITLSTCSYAYDGARYILIGRVTKLERSGK